jgi:hypothetical protein
VPGPGPGYPAYLYGPPGGPRRAPGTDGFAIAALVCSILGGILLAVIFALVALKRIRRSGEGGKGLAVSALVISGLWVLLIVAIGVLVLVFGASSSDRDPTGEITAPGSVAVDELRVGDCLAGLPHEGRVRDADTVPCSTPHRAQVYATFTLPKGDYPGDEQVAAQAEEGCGDRATDLDSDDEKLGLYLLYPRRANWSLGDRAVICIAEAKNGTMKGSLLP